MAQPIPAFICLPVALFSSDRLIIAAVLWPDPSLPRVPLLCPGPWELRDLPEVLQSSQGLPSWGSWADSCVLAACHPRLRISAEAGRAVRTDSLCVFHRRGIWGLALEEAYDSCNCGCDPRDKEVVHQTGLCQQFNFLYFRTGSYLNYFIDFLLPHKSSLSPG